MSCAEFERDVARLLAEEVAEDRRPAMLKELRSHVTGCADCAGSSDLLDLMALPAAERELAGDPDPAYWTDFTDRVTRRIRHEPAAPRRTWARGAWVVAAGAAAVAVLLWVARPDRTVVPADPSADSVADGGILDQNSMPDDSGMDPELDELAEILVGLGNSWEAAPDESGGGWLFPETEQLDPETRKRFLEWLQEQNSNGRGIAS